MFPESHKRLGRSGRNAWWGALLVIGAIAMYRWVVSPYVAYLHAVEQLAPAVERMVAENSRIRRSLGPGLRDLQNMRQEWAAVREGLFAEAEFTTFIRSLPTLVEQTGCTLVVADFTGGKDPGSARDAGPDVAFTTRQTGLTVRATLDQIAALLERLQENRPKVWVDAFRMERMTAPPAAPRNGTAEPFKCQLVLTMYTLAEPAPARSAERGSPVP